MNKQTRFWLRRTVFFVLLIMVVFAVYQAVTQADNGKPDVGDSAPNFTLTNLEGKEVSLKDYRGKAVMLNFWGTWCPPCKKEMPAMEAAYKKYKAQGFEIIAVNIAETDVAVASFAKHYGLTFPIWLDRDRDVVRQYKIGPLPSSIFIDADGKITTRVEGELNLGQLESYILPILPKK